MADEGLAGFHKRLVLATRDKVRPEEGTDQPSARRELLALHAFVQSLGPSEVAMRAGL